MESGRNAVGSLEVRVGPMEEERKHYRQGRMRTNGRGSPVQGVMRSDGEKG